MSDFQKELPSLLPEIMASPRLYLHTLDMEKRAALFVDADENFYKNAIFLDQGVLGPDTRSAWVPLDVLWRHVDAGAGDWMATARFIFHTGYCGATLISRLLDEIPTVLGLREPLVLRTLATGLQTRGIRPGEAYEGMFKRAYQLLVRRYSPTEQVIIKPTSMCNNLAAVLLAQNPANRGILLFVKLEVYLASLLDKKDTLDIDGLLAHRAACLGKIVPDLDVEIKALSLPEQMAFSWLTEAAQFHQLSTRGLAPRVLLMDFDRFLARRDDYLQQIFRHFSIPGTQEVLGKLATSPVFKSHSRQPDLAYTAVERQAALKQYRAANGPAIHEGIRFAERLMRTHPDLAEITQQIPLA